MGSVSTVVAGLVNFGNTCYANALLQALASCESYYEYTQMLCKTMAVPLGLTSSIGDSPTWKANLPLTRTLALCLERLQPSYLRAPSIASALEVLHAIGLHDRHLFQGFGEQQDVGEILDCLVTSSREEVQAWGEKYLQKRSALKLNESVPSVEASTSVWRRSGEGIRPVLPSEMHALSMKEFQSLGAFEGLLSHNLECCRCGHIFDVQLNPFTSLMLPIPRIERGLHELTADAEVTLESCLRDFFATKRQGPIQCPKCSLFCTVSCGTDVSVSPTAVRSSTSTTQSSFDEEINNCHKRHLGLSDILKEDKLEEMSLGGGVVYRCRASFDYKDFKNNTLKPSLPEPGSKGAVVKEVLAHAKGSSFHNTQVKQMREKLQEVGVPWIDADSHVLATTSIAKSPKRKIFDGTSYRKIEGRVRYPFFLGITCFMPFRSIHGTRYSLRAILVHQGNENGGHYITVRSILSQDGHSRQWIFVSDDKVYQISENAAMGLEASMLLYEREDNDTSPTACDSSAFFKSL